MIHADINAYNARQEAPNAAICVSLAALIETGLPQATSKVWHGGPVWFLANNPIVGYWVRKAEVRLLFWSGQSFTTPGLKPEGKFKAAEAHYQSVAEIDAGQIGRWLAEASVKQYDYANIVKRKGRLEKLGDWL